MSALRNIVFGCVSDHSQQAAAVASSNKRPINSPNEHRRSPTRVKFGVPLIETLKDDQLPEPLVEMIAYISREGVTTTDLFRRPGNPTDIKMITKKLTEGRVVDFSCYNFYTLASVVKKFLLKIPGGVFGVSVEQQLLQVLDIDDRMKQYSAIHEALSYLHLAGLQLVTLLFGTWFRIISHCEYNTMSSESVAKSIAGSVFHSCADNVENINRAVKVLRILIEDFAVADMFGAKSLEYFAAVTDTAISVTQHYEYRLNVDTLVTTTTTPVTHHTEISSAEQSTSLSTGEYELLPIFAQLVHNDVLCRGYNPAVTDSRVCESSSHICSPSALYTVRNSLEGSASTEFMWVHYATPTPPSVKLSPGEGEGEYNPGHKKLTHLSSLSAPEVNQVSLSVSPCVSVAGSASNSPYLSTSLTRFDSVRRRQLQRMRKRSDWFLSPSAATLPSADVSPSSPPQCEERREEAGVVGEGNSHLPTSAFFVVQSYYGESREADAVYSASTSAADEAAGGSTSAAAATCCTADCTTTTAAAAAASTSYTADVGSCARLGASISTSAKDSPAALTAASHRSADDLRVDKKHQIS